MSRERHRPSTCFVDRLRACPSCGTDPGLRPTVYFSRAGGRPRHSAASSPSVGSAPPTLIAPNSVVKSAGIDVQPLRRAK